MPCPAPGPTGFDLDVAVLVSPDVLDRADGRWTSRATGTPWRESLWRTCSGEYVVGLDCGGAGSSGLDPDCWRWVSAALAEDWLRSQGLHESADAAFGALTRRVPAPLTVHLDHDRRVRLEQLCADDDLSLEQVVVLALERWLRERAGPVLAVTPWWPAGVARDLRPGPVETVRPTARGLLAADAGAMTVHEPELVRLLVSDDGKLRDAKGGQTVRHPPA